jgi:uncharacterized protein (UPF0276 family)
MPAPPIEVKLMNETYRDETATLLAFQPALAGTGLKREHANEVLAWTHAIDLFEVHAENYMGDGGPPHRLLADIRARHPVSIHGVGLSIGAAEPLDHAHLARLKGLIDRYQPFLFSEHLAWSSHGGVFLNDLLPLPYNEATLRRVCDHIDQVQETLGTRMLLENPSTYVAFDTTMSEIEFLWQTVRHTGCGLLLDVNNVYVSAVNQGFDPSVYIDSFPVEHVGEVHLGGFAEDANEDGALLLIDDHGSAVAEAVWSLYRRTLARTGPVPTLIEWDNDVPVFAALANEVARAKSALLAEANRAAFRDAA